MNRASLMTICASNFRLPTRWKLHCMWLVGLLCGVWGMLASCSGEKDGINVETTTLHIDVGVSNHEIATRGLSDDPRNDDDTWSDWERLVDGRYLYRVTLMLVDRSNTLVGYKDFDDEIKSSTITTEVSASFGKLTPGTTYTLYALANYSAIAADNGGATPQQYGGLDGFPDVAALEVGSNVSTLLTNLQNYKLDAGSDLVSSQRPHPLTLVKEITLPASGGIYEVEGELIRTHARLRMEVANRSDRYDLNVNALTFGSAASKFGVQTTPLFMVPDNQIPVSAGNLDESSNEAMTFFDSSLTVSKMDASNDVPQNSAVIFDGYLYECRNTAGFEYTLDLGYDVEKTVTKTVYKKGTGSNSPQTGTGLYLIGYGNNNYFLTAGESAVVGTQISASELDETQYKQAIWEVYRNGNTITIKSELNGNYINIPTSNNSSVTLGNSSNLSLTTSNGRIYRSRSYYMYMSNNSAMVSTNSSNRTNFTFYPLSVEKEEITESIASKEFTVPMQTLIDGVAQTTSIIRRNDFINVLVTVSYNENTGTMDFHVEDWTSKNGVIEFD